MLFYLPCPACKEWVQVDGDHAGTLTTCTKCAAHFLIPDPGLLASKAPPPPPPPRLPDTEEQADDEEEYDDEPDHDETGAEPGETQEGDDADENMDIGLGAPAAGGVWAVPRNGLLLVQISMLAFFVTCLLLIFLAAAGGGRHRDRFFEEPRFLLFSGLDSGVVGCVGFLIFVSILIGFVGQCLCCTSQPEGGARSRATVAVVCALGAAVLFALTVILQINASPFGPRDPLVLLYLLFVAAVLLAKLFWVLFLKAAADTSGNYVLGRQLALYIVLFFLWISLTFCVNLGMRIDDAGMILLALPLNLVCPVVLYFWLLVLTVRTRNTLFGRSG